MRIEYLSYLLDIAQTHSISKTADHFYVTQQAVSAAIKKLEQELNVSLLKRTKHGVQLTPMGEFAVQKSQDIMQSYQELRDGTNDFRFSKLRELDGSLDVYVHPRIYQYILSPVIHNFRDRCPNIKLKIKECRDQAILTNLLTQPTAVSVTCLHGNIARAAQINDLDLEEKFTLQICHQEDMLLCVHADSPWGELSVCSPEDFLDIPLITYDFDPSFAIPAHNDLPKDPAFVSNNLVIHKQTISQKLAAEILTASEFNLFWKDANDPTPYKLIPFSADNSIKLTTAIVTLKEQPLTLQAEFFSHLLSQTLGVQGDAHPDK